MLHPDSAAAGGGGTRQRPSSSQIAGKAQSATSAHDVRHAVPSQTYGAQSTVSPDVRSTVRSSTQWSPPTHCPPSHRVPWGHASFDAHDVGQLTLFPSHAYGAQVGAPVARDARRVQVPRGSAHVSHALPHARSQQIPDTQKPLRQSAGFSQKPPGFDLHFPSPSHVRSPSHEPGSSAFFTTVHAPGVALHVEHGASHALSQQSASLQKRVEQAVDAVHALPAGIPDETKRVRTRDVATFTAPSYRAYARSTDAGSAGARTGVRT